MIEDPIVEEVREARDEHAQQFDYDLDTVGRDLQQKQEQPVKNVVSFPPRRPPYGTGRRSSKNSINAW